MTYLKLTLEVAALALPTSLLALVVVWSVVGLVKKVFK